MGAISSFWALVMVVIMMAVFMLFKVHLEFRINKGLIPYLLNLLVVTALVLQCTFLLDLRDALLYVLNRKKLFFSWFCAEVLNV